jgi:hypothetical protein
MANKIQPKRSYTANAVPAADAFEVNEIGFNWADGKLFVKKPDGSYLSFDLGTGTNFTPPGVGGSVSLWKAEALDRVYHWST